MPVKGNGNLPVIQAFSSDPVSGNDDKTWLAQRASVLLY
jgi:hypothetical protein